ncbi:lysine transporter LysE [Phreatobacter aquaticus]|uniref:Lysine transporter LysE n=1 Tax=Phreatobacter aquaticus TaxID=2570229 RepID=A0A4D7QAC7_9HYPH|nr:LysE family transporter [Phreatobacter aquaticus]QCK85040.1 lysine transporter LysE [Phreatobacter aquaticus]
MHDPLLFALTVLTLLGTPGPTNTLLATAGAASGWRNAFRLILAENLGYLLAILSIGLLLGPVIAAAPAIGIGLRIAVGLYLALVAWRLWRAGAAQVARSAALVKPGQIFLTTLLNPKAIVFAVAVVPFDADHVMAYLAAFSGLCAMVALGWISIGHTLGAAAGRSGHARLIPRVGAAGVGTFAVTMIVLPLLR